MSCNNSIYEDWNGWVDSGSSVGHRGSLGNVDRGGGERGRFELIGVKTQLIRKQNIFINTVYKYK